MASAVVGVFALSLPAGAQVVSEPLGPVIVVSHRGASAYAPEHTFAAYDLAIAQDTDMLECDLQLTADDVLVCVHDGTVDRTSDGTGAIKDMTLAELRELDWGSWFGPDFVGAAIVPFEEQLRCYRAINPKMRFHVETKEPEAYAGRMEPAVVALLDRLEILDELNDDAQLDPIIIQSFSMESLLTMVELEPRLATAYLFATPPPSYPGVALGQLPDGIDVVAPSKAYLAANVGYVAAAHAQGHEVHTYTVDDTTEMQGLLALGVDGIFTNRTDVGRAEIDKTGRGTTPEQRANPDAFAPGCPGIAGTVVASSSAEPSSVTPTTTTAGSAPSTSGPSDAVASGRLPATGMTIPVALALALMAVALAGRRLRA